LSDEAEIKDEVELATRALDAMISARLTAGGNRYVLAATCVWGGVKEMSEITSPRSAAAALRAIASQIDPLIDLPAADRSEALMTAVRDQGVKQRQDNAQLSPFNQELVRDVISEAIDLIDQAQSDHARALLMALRSRLSAGGPRPQNPAPRRRWGG
jgi:hypothetical protein